MAWQASFTVGRIFQGEKSGSIRCRLGPQDKGVSPTVWWAHSRAILLTKHFASGVVLELHGHCRWGYGRLGVGCGILEISC
jgi:hypothetical protein